MYPLQRFWFGDDYTKTVASEDDPYVTGNFTNCTKVQPEYLVCVLIVGIYPLILLKQKYSLTHIIALSVTSYEESILKVGHYYDYQKAEISSFTFECRESNKVPFDNTYLVLRCVLVSLIF